MSKLTRVLWLSIVVTVALAIVMGVEVKHYAQPCPGTDSGCLKDCARSSPIAALELSTRFSCFREWIEQGDPANAARNIQIVHTNTLMDFLFIVLYWSVFFFFARAFDGALSRWVIMAISIAAIFDFAENFLLLHALNSVSAGALDGRTPGVVSHVKWIFFGIATFVLGVALAQQRGLWIKAIAGLMLASGVLTLVGQFQLPVLRLATMALALALLVGVAYFFPRPRLNR